MTRSEIAEQLKAYLETLSYDRHVELTESTDLLDDWFVDSIGIVDTVLFMETHFGIDIKRSDINRSNFQSIATLSEFVEARLDA